MDKDASLLEAGLLVGGGHLVAHPQLHLGRAEFEAGDDGCVVRQLSFCQQCGSCNALVLNFNWNMEGVSDALAVFSFFTIWEEEAWFAHPGVRAALEEEGSWGSRRKNSDWQPKWVWTGLFCGRLHHLQAPTQLGYDSPGTWVLPTG